MDKERLEAMGAEALVEELSDRLDQMGDCLLYTSPSPRDA